MSEQKECKRHKWSFVRNVEIWRMGPRTGSMKLRGLWRCGCGAKKYGTYMHSAPAPELAKGESNDR